MNGGRDRTWDRLGRVVARAVRDEVAPLFALLSREGPFPLRHVRDVEAEQRLAGMVLRGELRATLAGLEPRDFTIPICRKVISGALTWEDAEVEHPNLRRVPRSREAWARMLNPEPFELEELEALRGFGFLDRDQAHSDAARLRELGTRRELVAVLRSTANLAAAPGLANLQRLSLELERCTAYFEAHKERELAIRELRATWGDREVDLGTSHAPHLEAADRAARDRAQNSDERDAIRGAK